MPHVCGNPFHDLPQLLLGIPFALTLVAYVRHRLAHRHSGDCEH